MRHSSNRGFGVERLLLRCPLSRDLWSNPWVHKCPAPLKMCRIDGSALWSPKNNAQKKRTVLFGWPWLTTALILQSLLHQPLSVSHQGSGISDLLISKVRKTPRKRNVYKNNTALCSLLLFHRKSQNSSPFFFRFAVLTKGSWEANWLCRALKTRQSKKILLPNKHPVKRCYRGYFQESNCNFYCRFVSKLINQCKSNPV